LLDYWIRLGMNGSGIQRILAVTYAQETGGLLKGLCADAGDFGELLARMEAAMLVTVGDDVQSDALGCAAASTRRY
jgi:hypothetical protein